MHGTQAVVQPNGTAASVSFTITNTGTEATPPLFLPAFDDSSLIQVCTCHCLTPAMSSPRCISTSAALAGFQHRRSSMTRVHAFVHPLCCNQQPPGC